VDAFTTPLIECFRQGEAPPDVRLLAARGGLLLRPEAQLSLLMLLTSDPDAEVAAAARRTIARLPPKPLAALLARDDVPDDVRAFFAGAAAGQAQADGTAESEGHEDVLLELDAARGPDADEQPAPSVDAARSEADEIEATPERRGAAQRLGMLTVSERMKVAMQGSREERSILVRDPNRLVSSAVLSSPKLTESEVEAIARMTNVSADVLRTVGSSRVWLKNYTVVAALARNSKTPIAVSLPLLKRLNERDIKSMASDRNIPEPIRLAARKMYVQHASRRQ